MRKHYRADLQTIGLLFSFNYELVHDLLFWEPTRGEVHEKEADQLIEDTDMGVEEMNSNGKSRTMEKICHT